jgi:dCTP deaminase
LGGTKVTVLSTEAILSRLRETNSIDRLIVSPLLDEKEQAKDGQAAIDVRLGFNFCLVLPSAFGSITEFQNGGQDVSFSKLYRREFCPFGSSIVIHPHQFILAQTLEYIRLPSDLMAYVAGRSTWGRLGLIVATAVGIHPGFAGNLTLELRNLGETPLTLYPGQTIAQLFFHLVIDPQMEPSKAKAKRAQYVGTVDMVPRQISSKATSRTLKRLIRRFDKLSLT